MADVHLNVSNNAPAAAPSICGGAVTVTWTATSSCEPNVTATSTFTIPAAPAVVLTAPANFTATTCQTQAQIDAAYATWLAGVTSSGGCNLTVTNNAPAAAPSICGGAVTVTWTATSSCEPNVTATSTFTIPAAPPVVLTAPANFTATSCQTQAQIDAAYATWLAGVTSSGGCNLTVTNNAPAAAPSICGGAVTVTWTATSSCEPNVTATSTFTIPAAPPVVLTAPANFTATSCQTQAQIDAAYATWLAGVTSSGGCNLTVTNNAPAAAPSICGGAVTVTWTATSSCEPNVTATSTFTIPAAPAVVLTAPANFTATSCQTQAQIDAAYATWLAGVTSSGGCTLSCFQ